MRRFVRLLLVLSASLMIGWTGLVRAADPPKAKPKSDSPPVLSIDPNDGAKDLAYSPEWPDPPNTGAMLTRLCLGTVFVLALCVGTLWLGKPWLQKLQVRTAGNQAMQVEATVTLGNRAVLYLVKIGDTQLVAGTDAGGLKSLLALPASFKEVLDTEVPTESIAPALPAGFDAHFPSPDSPAGRV